MKDKTAALDLFHDIELPAQNVEPDFLEMESEQQEEILVSQDIGPEQPDDETVLIDRISDQIDDEPDSTNPASNQREEEFASFPKSYRSLSAYPRITGMILPGWVFCPFLPFGLPVMAFFPVIIYS